MICIHRDNVQPMVKLLNKKILNTDHTGGKKELEVEFLIQPLSKLKTLLMMLIFVLSLHFTVHFHLIDSFISLPTSS